MQNINYCQSCKIGEKTREINILGKHITVKNYICSADGINYKEKPENIKLQLFVNMLTFCPANCRFCVAKNTKQQKKIDIDKFKSVMKLLKAEDRIRGIKITGGEPFYDIDLLNEVISAIYDIFGYETEVAISTNGTGLENLKKIKDLEHIETIHLSRHHYDDNVNRELFGNIKNIPDKELLKDIIGSVSYKDIFVLNCILLKDYINSPEEAHKFMDFAIDIGAPKVGFMTCSPVNGYAKEQSIPYEAVIKGDDPALLFTRGFFDYDYCHCSDGVYSSEDGRIVEFYGKSTKMEDYAYCRGLVYDADDHLKDGFGGNIIM
ncbi:MAG: radical SAM protein [Lachnospiraceae bacterium]|nr:radical SAM protein [Lachnospiraceae bacterium]